jgi:hypothetical protein
VYYLLAIKYYVGTKKKVRRFRDFNISYEELCDRYIQPYSSNTPILIAGRKILISQIEQFLVFSSTQPIEQDMLLSTGAKVGEEKHDVMVNCLRKGEFNAVEGTSEFLHLKVT